MFQVINIKLKEIKSKIYCKLIENGNYSHSNLDDKEKESQQVNYSFSYDIIIIFFK